MSLIDRVRERFLGPRDRHDSPRPETNVEASTREFLAALPTPTAFVSADSVWLNAAASELTGYGTDEIRDDAAWRSLFPGTPISRDLNGSQPRSSDPYQAEISTRTGANLLVEVSVAVFRDGALWTLRELRDDAVTDDRYRVLFEHSTDAHLILDDNGILDCNNAAVMMLHCKDKQQLLASHPVMFSPPYQPDGLPSRDRTGEMERLAWENGYHRFLWTHRRMDGTDFPVEVTLNPVQLIGGRALLVVWHDLTEQNHKNAQLLLARESAEAATRAKGEFLANMSHEIRTPMNSILGFAGLCLQTELGEKQREYVSRVQTAARGLLVIINDILDFSKLDAEMLSLEAAPFELRATLEALDSIVGPLASDKDVVFEWSCADDVPAFVVGDSLRLGQVLLNLASNAVKFTDRGTVSVEVAVAVNQADTDTVELDFRVRDSGIGLTVEETDRLFASFTQADTSTTRKYGGTGLGLVISKQLVALMGGQIRVESEPGQGSVFSFTAPFGHTTATHTHDLSQTTLEELEAAYALLQGTRVLVVEDNVFNQQLARELLEQHGATVDIANNGREALDHLHTHPCDIILMDVQMPVMDGYQATQQIRATPTLAHHTVIGLTANAMAEDRQKCLDAGMNDIQIKPIDPNTLYLTLAHWLPPHQATTPGKDTTAAAPTDTPQIDTPPIDMAVLGKLLNNDPAKMQRFAHQFLQTAVAAYSEIEAAHSCRDATALAALGHKHKSAATAVGATSFATLCQELETAGNTGNWAHAQTLINQLPRLLHQITLQIQSRTC